MTPVRILRQEKKLEGFQHCCLSAELQNCIQGVTVVSRVVLQSEYWQFDPR